MRLVIGNSDYLYTKSLKNPLNDANDFAEKLKSLGFEVISGTNLNMRQTETLIREFGTRLIQTRGVGLFFYAGHGLQYRGDNYLIPVDADILAEDEIKYKAVNVGLLLGKLETAKNNLNLIILDACRDNPFAPKWSASRDLGENGGLAKMSAPTGTMLIYATQPGNIASDGEGRNGLFTGALLSRIDEPNVELDRLIKNIANDVAEKSNNKQTPWKEGIVLGDFYFVKQESKPSTQSANNESSVTPPTNTASTVSNARQREDNAWNLVKNSLNADDYKFFLEEFPSGVYSIQAKRKIEQFAWDEARNSENKSVVLAYLEKFPDGLNSAAARIKLRQLESRQSTVAAVVPEANKKETAVETEVADNDSEKKQEAIVEKIAPVKKGKIESVVKTPKTNLPTRKLTGKLPKVTSRADDLGIEFILIPAGGFLMGASSTNIAESKKMARNDYADFEMSWIENESPARPVEIPEDFWMGKTEVTQAQWERVMGENPSYNKTCRDCPVERVSWVDAKEFIRRLNETNNGFVYSLPTEAEWEYAARGGTARLFAGNVDDISWHSGNSEGVTHPVALRLPNSFGLYDMNGNVAEWCEDLYMLYSDSSGQTEDVGGQHSETRSASCSRRFVECFPDSSAFDRESRSVADAQKYRYRISTCRAFEKLKFKLIWAFIFVNRYEKNKNDHKHLPDADLLFEHPRFCSGRNAAAAVTLDNFARFQCKTPGIGNCRRRCRSGQIKYPKEEKKCRCYNQSEPPL